MIKITNNQLKLFALINLNDILDYSGEEVYEK